MSEQKEFRDGAPSPGETFRGPVSDDVVDEAAKAGYSQLLKTRDQAAKAEQELENDIFSNSAVRTDVEIKALITQYRRLKDKRTEASLKAAEAFMRLNPADRQAATKEWSGSEEGKRKADGSGIRGGQSSEQQNTEDVIENKESEGNGSKS